MHLERNEVIAAKKSGLCFLIKNVVCETQTIPLIIFVGYGNFANLLLNFAKSILTELFHIERLREFEYFLASSKIL